MKSRLWRSLTITIIEGRGIGELADQPLRTPNSSNELHATRSPSSSAEPLSKAASTSSSSNRPLSLGFGSPARGGAIGEASTRDRDTDGNSNLDTFVEIVLNGEVVIRSSVRKSTTSPFFAESFTLRLVLPLESCRAELILASTVDFLLSLLRCWRGCIKFTRLLALDRRWWELRWSSWTNCREVSLLRISGDLSRLVSSIKVRPNLSTLWSVY